MSQPQPPVFDPGRPRICSIARALEVLGQKWSLLVVREVFYGVRRFEQIVANTGAPRDVLTTRLRTLVDVGVLAKVAYSQRPPRWEYQLTDAGRDLLPVLMALMRWGDQHLAGSGPVPVVWRHDCGHDLVPQIACTNCARPVVSDQLALVRTTESA